MFTGGFERCLRVSRDVYMAYRFGEYDAMEQLLRGWQGDTHSLTKKDPHWLVLKKIKLRDLFVFEEVE